MTALTETVARFLHADPEPPDQRNAMTAAMRDPRLRAVHWRDLTVLSRSEVAWELSLIWPWLAASLIFAEAGSLAPALAASFMVFLTGLRQSHNAQHSALGLGRRGTAAWLFLLSIVMLGSMHAVKFNHLRHHKHCMTARDTEGMSARMSGWQALAFGPVFPLVLHWTALKLGNRAMRRWVAVELGANVLWIGLVFGVLDVTCLQYHVLAMAAGQCLTAFFAVWTVHNHCGGERVPARTLRRRFWNRASYHMFLHVEHHLFPAVPTQRLPTLARRLDAALGREKLATVF